jgi:hypothetical protein
MRRVPIDRLCERRLSPNIRFTGAFLQASSGRPQHADNACIRILIKELAMLIDTSRARLLLQRGQTSRLSGANHAYLASASGTLWVTIDHDRRDIVLEAGQGFDVASREDVLVCALGGPAVLDLRPAGEAR